MRCWLPVLLLQLLLPRPPRVASCPARCECAPQLRSVVCHRKRLTSIPEGIPSETKILELSKNRIRCLNPGDLSPYPLLEELDFSENIISNVEPGAFGNLFHLQTLRLRGNQLKLIPPGVFTKLSNLTLLDLSENKLVILLDYMFQDLRNLKSLEVGDNDLVYISQRAFSGLLGLEQLTIERCNLTSLSAESLSHLQNLEVLRLRHLSIAALEEQNFRRLPNLLQLEIDNWPLLEDVSPTSFQGLNLTWLSITYTNLTAVPAAALRNLPYLRYLNLSFNPISALPRGSFRDLVRLQELHIAAATAGGNDTYFATLTVQGRRPAGPRAANRSLDPADFNDTAHNDTQVLLKFTLDLKTILVSTAMGCITFLGVVLFCFLLLFVWSRGRGQHKNNFSVEYSFRKVDGPAAT
ncbi:Leucine-rich repeat and immunoglobulin-like domain-containing nogo receptor-interacting protein 3, partial [Dryobates pubescens]